MFFFNILKSINYLKINKKNNNIIYLSKKFNSLNDTNFEINKNFYNYIENIDQYKEFIEFNFRKNFILKLKNNKFFNITKIIKFNKIYLIFNNITDIYNLMEKIKQENLNLLYQVKKTNLEIKNTNKILNNNFIFCIFKENGIILESSILFNEIYDNENIKKFFDNYKFHDIIYDLKNKKKLNITNYYDNDIYNCIIEILDNKNIYLKLNNITPFIKMKKELKKTSEIIINIITDMINDKSRFTGEHIERVKQYTELLAKLYQKNYSSLLDSEIELLGLASMMHDIGKLKINSEVLEKQGKLTKEEITYMNQHTTFGKNIVDKYNTNKSELMEICKIVAYEHHEKWNGKGYPEGKKGNEIHLYSRIVALADVFDALISDRPYKKGWEPEKIKELLIKEKGKSFDPLLIDLIIENFNNFLEINNNNKNKN